MPRDLSTGPLVYLSQDNVSSATRRLIRTLWLVSLAGIIFSLKSKVPGDISFAGIPFDIEMGELRSGLALLILFFLIAALVNIFPDYKGYRDGLVGEITAARNARKSLYKHLYDIHAPEKVDRWVLNVTFLKFGFVVGLPLVTSVCAILSLFFWVPSVN